MSECPPLRGVVLSKDKCATCDVLHDMCRIVWRHPTPELIEEVSSLTMLHLVPTGDQEMETAIKRYKEAKAEFKAMGMSICNCNRDPCPDADNFMMMDALNRSPHMHAVTHLSKACPADHPDATLLAFARGMSDVSRRMGEKVGDAYMLTARSITTNVTLDLVREKLKEVQEVVGKITEAARIAALNDILAENALQKSRKKKGKRGKRRGKANANANANANAAGIPKPDTAPATVVDTHEVEESPAPPVAPPTPPDTKVAEEPTGDEGECVPSSSDDSSDSSDSEFDDLDLD